MKKKRKSIDELIKTVSRLRDPKHGCPWDKIQTHKSLKRYLIEETYEAIDAIENNDSKSLMEELGDILLQIVLHSQIASEKKLFNFNNVADYINKKMINRHPHVFSNVIAKTPADVMKNWEIIKRKEKPKRKELLDGIPNSLPALLKALKISKKVTKEGFNWNNEKILWKTFKNEMSEFKQAVKQKNKRKHNITEELGDLLFMTVNLARWYKLDPEDALNIGLRKFVKRYNKVKLALIPSNKDINQLSSLELDKLWKKVKKEEK